MKKYRIAKIFGGYKIQDKWWLFWIDTEIRSDGLVVCYRTIAHAQSILDEYKRLDKNKIKVVKKNTI